MPPRLHAFAAVGLLFAVAAAAHAGKPAYPETAKIPVAETYHDVTVSGSVPLARERHRGRRHRMGRRAERAHAPLARRAAGARRGRRTDRQVAAIGTCRALRLPVSQAALRLQAPAAARAAAARRAEADGCRVERAHGARSGRARSQRPYDDRFLPALARRKHVVVSLSKDGSEDGTAHVFDVATGKRLPDVVPGVNFPPAAAASNGPPTAAGFYYTRYPQRRRATPKRPPFPSAGLVSRARHADGAAIATRSARTFPGSPKSSFARSEDGRHLLASVANGDGGEFALPPARRRTAAGPRSPASRTRSSRSCSATTATCTRSR